MKKLIVWLVSMVLVVVGSQSAVQAAARQLTDQQVGILVGLAVDPQWVRQQLAGHRLVYGIVRPGDQVPAGVADYSYLVAAGDDSRMVYYQQDSSRRVIVKVPVHGRLQTKKVTIKQLTHRFYRSGQQRRQVNNYVSALRTE